MLHLVSELCFQNILGFLGSELIVFRL